MYEYHRVMEDLRIAYDRASAERRDAAPKAGWKMRERERFLDLLQREEMKTLLEVGAGTGQDSLFFQQHGLRVVCTDLSPAMVDRCRAKGLDARVADFLGLDFPAASFDAVYAFNCLLHVPSGDLGRVLGRIRQVLRPGGLMYLGVYGHEHGEEGLVSDDQHPVPRFFAFRTDARMRDAVAAHFGLVSFDAISLDRTNGHFQSMVLRRSGALREVDLLLRETGATRSNADQVLQVLAVTAVAGAQSAAAEASGVDPPLSLLTRYLIAVWGAESPSELSGDPPRPARISRRPCSSSSSTPASGSSSTSPLHPPRPRR